MKTEKKEDEEQGAWSGILCLLCAVKGVSKYCQRVLLIQYRYWKQQGIAHEEFSACS
jgi:hypothetical protein